MLYFISLIHALTCVFIVIFILLQDPKGGVLGNLGGGGGSKSLFGSQGAGGFLVTATKWLAILFAITSISLSYISSLQNKASVMEQSASIETPSKKPPQAAPSTDTPSANTPETAPLEDTSKPEN